MSSLLALSLRVNVLVMPSISFLFSRLGMRVYGFWGNRTAVLLQMGINGCFLFSSSDDMGISYQLAASIVGAAWWSHTIYGIVYLFMDHAVGGKFTVY